MQSQRAVDNSSQNDKQAIRDVVHTWLEASKKNDSSTLLKLLADDVIFITPGREPFGKEAFASDKQMKDVKMEADIEIKELEVAGDWAWMRSFLNVTFTPKDGNRVKHAGHILTIFQKQPDGWVIKRDANFVQPQESGS